MTALRSIEIEEVTADWVPADAGEFSKHLVGEDSSAARALVKLIRTAQGALLVKLTRRARRLERLLR